MCAVVARWSTPNGAYRGKHFRAPVGVTTTDEERHDQGGAGGGVNPRGRDRMLGMSMEIEAFFNSSTEVTASSWQDEITRLGFPLVIDPGLDIDRVAGFQPAVFRDEKTGFECYRSSGDQSAGRAALRQEVSDRDACITFRWGGDLKEMAAAIGAAAALV